MIKHIYPLAAVRSFIAFFLLTGLPVFGATGTIFYNSSTGSPAKTVRAISADGANSREISLSVPSPALPTVSRDGRSLLVTSGGPLASVMLSQNVFRIDLATGVTTPITHYVDTTSDGITTYTNYAGEPDFTTYSYYTTHLPNHKAFSPSGDRVAVLDLSAVSGREPGGIRLAAVQSPVLEVYPVQQAFPIGDRLLTGAERTSVNQAGDGLDWHPTREELVGPFRSDIPSFGNFGESQTEGTVVMVFATSGTSPFLRRLTAPTGRYFHDFNAFFSTSETEQDYAPAISRDGSKVAYVRNTIAADTRNGLGFQLAKCAIHIVNYDGSGDRELVSFGDNRWITKVAWSPDDTELVFDIAPRLVVNGLELQMGDPALSAIHIVRVSDASTRLLVPAPAAYPSWSPLSSAPDPVKAPEFRVTRAGNQIDLQISNLTIGQQFDLESTTNLVSWTTSQTITASAETQTVSVPLSGQERGKFFRVRLR
jgi:hypothetical protein